MPLNTKGRKILTKMKKNYGQKRSMESKKVKSDWIVIGRSVTRGSVKKNIQKLIKSL